MKAVVILGLILACIAGGNSFASPDITDHLVVSKDATYVWNYKRVEQKTAGSAEWSRVPLPRNASANITELSASGNAVYLLTGNAVFESRDGGQNWRFLSATPLNVDAQHLSVTESDMWIAGVQATAANIDELPNVAIDPSGQALKTVLARQPRGGGNWVITNVGQCFGPVAQLITDDHMVLVTTPFQAERSMDYGKTWSPITVTTAGTTELPTPTSASCVDSAHCWVAFTGGQVVTTAASARHVLNPKGAHGGFDKLRFVTATVGVGINGGKLKISDDGGRSWHQVRVSQNVIDFDIRDAHIVTLLRSGGVEEINIPVKD
jgi:photosystem II stability/assembly factor-like uncharacterized protein